MEYIVRLLDPVTRKQTRKLGVRSNEEAVRKAQELASANKGKVAVVQAYKRSPGGVFADAYLARYLTDDDPKLAELDDDWLFWFASDPKLWSW